MASKSERLISEALGHPQSAFRNERVGFTSTASGIELASNTTYRVAANQDCFLHMSSGSNDIATDKDTPLFAGLPEVFTTTAGVNYANMISNGTDGTVWFTRMSSRGK